MDLTAYLLTATAGAECKRHGQFVGFLRHYLLSEHAFFAPDLYSLTWQFLKELLNCFAIFLVISLTFRAIKCGNVDS